MALAEEALDGAAASAWPSLKGEEAERGGEEKMGIETDKKT